MASLRRLPNSRYWIACYTDQHGNQRQRSTKETNRAKALKIAESFESAHRTAQTEAQARRVVADIYEAVNGAKLSWSSLRDFVANWLNRKRIDTAEGTLRRYQQVTKDFVGSIGSRADKSLEAISKSDVQNYRDAVALRLSPTSANIYLKVIRSIFQEAWRDDLVSDNPAAKIKLLKVAESLSSRRPFTAAELDRLLAVAEGEWKGLILGGLYTAQRLGDVASLTWASIDFKQQQVAFAVLKTGRRRILPLHPAFEKYLREQVEPIARILPIFPKAFQVVKSQGRTGTLSNQFAALLAKASLVDPRSHKARADTPGRKGKRQTTALSFHSLRHTATSLMKNAGVSDAIAMDVVGHESKAISKTYTHIEEGSRRKAIMAIPDFGPRTNPNAAKTAQEPELFAFSSVGT